MQYLDYTIYHQLNDKTLYIKVINNMMLTIYETNLIKNQFKYKLEIVNNIFIEYDIDESDRIQKQTYLIDCLYHELMKTI
jgi:hypothetical protein